MPQSLYTTLKVGSLKVANTATLNNVRLTRSSASQGTSLTSGVTLNSPAGFIYTFTTGTLATAGTASFTVTNSSVLADSIVFGNIQNYNGTGLPVSRVTNVTEGSFSVKLTNADLTNGVSGSLKFGFGVL